MELGASLATYRRRFGDHPVWITIAAVLFIGLFGGGLASCGNWGGYSAAGLVVGGIGYVWLRLIPFGGCEIAVHAHGFQYRERGRHIQARWEDIKELYTRQWRDTSGLMGRNSVLSAALISGEEIWLQVHDSRGHSILQNFIDRATPAMVEGARAAAARGERLEFGPIALEPEALKISMADGTEKAIGHEAISGLRVDAGYLVIEADGQVACSAELGTVANLPALLDQLQARVADERPGQR